MTQENGKQTDDTLDRLFQEARDTTAPPSYRLMQADLSAATSGSVDLLSDVPDADYALYTDIEDLLTEGS